MFWFPLSVAFLMGQNYYYYCCMFSLSRLFAPVLTIRPRYHIISNLFRKKNQAESESASASASSQKKAQKKQQTSKEMQDEQYNFFERRREIDTGVDFSKLRETSYQFIPEKLGEGGIEEVLYWSQSAITPQQIKTLVTAFNRVVQRSPVELSGNAQMQQFKTNVIGSVYLVDSLATLQQYAIFAMRFNISEGQFWQKVQFKCLKYPVDSVEEVGYLVDIVFVAGQFSAGEDVFNFAQKILAEKDLTAQQYIKLFLVFSNLKRGEKPWIQKMLSGIRDTMGETDCEQLASVLPNLKEVKKLPQDLNEKVQKQVEELLPHFTLPQLLRVTEYFGFEMEDEAFWGKLQLRLEELLSGKKVGARLLEQLTLKAMLSYRLSTDFIRRHIVPHLSTAMLQKLPPKTLSSLSKGLYIYQLQNETKAIEQQIGRLLIGKISQQINELPDADLVRVIQDYNLTRHGGREIYIFFEEVIKIKYLKHYNPELDRNTIELLVNIYENSGMCSRDMLDSLQNLILQ